jgi:hypothetical protein
MTDETDCEMTLPLGAVTLRRFGHADGFQVGKSDPPMRQQERGKRRNNCLGVIRIAHNERQGASGRIATM